MLGTYLSILRRRWSMVVLATIILAPMAFLVLTASSGVYQSTAIVQVLNASVAEGVLGTTRGYQDPERLLASEIEVLNSPAVAEGAAERLQEDGWEVDAEAVRTSVEVAPRGVSSYIEVVGSDPDPTRAQQLTSAFVDSYRGYKLDLQREELERLDQDLQERLADTEAELVALDAAAEGDGAAARQRAALLGRYESLSRLIEDIRLRLSVDTSGVEVLTQASEPEPASGALSPVPAAVAALLAAAAVASALAVLLDLLRDPVRTREEAERLVPDASVVTLPVPTGDRDDRVTAVSDPHSSTARGARTVQQRWAPLLRESGSRRLVVSSTPDNGEQRVHVATALAAAAARAGSRVLLVGDLLDRSLLTTDQSRQAGGASSDDVTGVRATTLPGVWWTASTVLDGLHDGAGEDPADVARAFDLVVRVREDGDPDTDAVDGPVPFVAAVASLGRTRARHLASHVRELEAAGLPVSGLVLVQASGGRSRRSSRRRRSGRRTDDRAVLGPDPGATGQALPADPGRRGTPRTPPSGRRDGGAQLPSSAPDRSADELPARAGRDSR